MDKVNMIDMIWECIGKIKGVSGVLNAIENVNPEVVMDNRQEICDMLFRELKSVEGQLMSFLEEQNNSL